MALHHYHGVPWYVLMDRTSGMSFRTQTTGYELLRQFDGQRSLDQIWQAMANDNHPDLPPQDEVIELMARLFESNLIQVDSPAKARRLHHLQKQQLRQKWMQLIKSPISQRLPLFDPRPLLNRTEWVGRLLFSQFGAFAMLLLMGAAALTAFEHWDALTRNLADRMLAPDNLLLMVLVYPLIKALHEMGHAWCNRRFGGEVTEMGVMFLLFIPIPYVDASSSNFFSHHGKRALVALAGILTELGIGAVALLIWAELGPGVGRAIMFNVIVICTISSVLFNGNPLLRFDAYYVLSDLTQSPNLGSRGNAVVGRAAKRLLGLPPGIIEDTASRQHQLWMGLYAILAYGYRLFISFGIALLLLRSYPLVGQPLAVWAVYGSILQPMVSGLRKLHKESVNAYQARVWIRFGLISAALIAAIGWLPLPKSSQFSAIASAEQSAQLAANTEGKLAQIVTPSGRWVEPGDLIARVTPDRLHSERLALMAQRDSLAIKIRAQVAGTEAGLAQVLRDELNTTEQSLAQVEQQIRNADIRAQQSGLWLWNAPEPVVGSLVFRGQTLGAYDRNNNRQALGFLPTHTIADFERGTGELWYLDPTKPFQRHALTGFTLVRSGTRLLPDNRLSSQYGGRVLTEPGQRPGEVRAVTPGVWFSAVGASLSSVPLGQLIEVRVEHPPEALGPRLWRGARRTFLGLLGPQ